MAIYETMVAMGEAELAAQRRRFVIVQAAKAGVGVGLAILFIAVVGRPDVTEWIAVFGLARLGDARPGRAGGGIDRLECRPGDGVDPFAADEEPVLGQGHAMVLP